jgi:hypothetical protein
MSLPHKICFLSEENLHVGQKFRETAPEEEQGNEHGVTSGRKTEPSKPSTHTLGYYIAAEYSIFTWRARLWLAEETDAGALSDEHTVRYRHLQECMAHGKHDMTRETQRYKMHTNLTLGLTF